MSGVVSRKEIGAVLWIVLISYLKNIKFLDQLI